MFSSGQELASLVVSIVRGRQLLTLASVQRKVSPSYLVFTSGKEAVVDGIRLASLKAQSSPRSCYDFSQLAVAFVSIPHANCRGEGPTVTFLAATVKLNSLSRMRLESTVLCVTCSFLSSVSFRQ